MLTYGYAHIAFSLGSHAAVDKLTAELVDDGYGRRNSICNDCRFACTIQDIESKKKP